jgi:hypothetical protein
LGVEPPNLGVAERGALLGVTVDLAEGVIDIDERDLVATGEKPGNLRGPARKREATASSC